MLFLRRLDDLQTLEENKAARLNKPIERQIFPKGKDAKGRPYQDFRWSHFKNFAPADMFTVISEHVFPFLRTLGGDESTYAHHMKDARFTEQKLRTRAVSTANVAPCPNSFTCCYATCRRRRSCETASELA